MKYLPDAALMKAADSYTITQLGIPSIELMERAATACVEYMEEEFWDTSRVCVVCGSGNNGGDGFAIGRLLLAKGSNVTMFFAGNMQHRTKETIYQMELFEKAGGIVETRFPAGEYSVVVDALFGIGLSREITGDYRRILTLMNELSGKKLAVDIPSGISASTGQVMGIAFRADVTVTFQEEKFGMAVFPGCEYVGEIITADIGIDNTLIKNDSKTAFTIEYSDAKKMLPERREDSNKGSFGRMLLIAGCKGMAGAAYLSAAAAYRTGAGLVQIYTAEENRSILQQLIPEAIVSVYKEYNETDLLDKLAWADVVCIGPGLGMSSDSESILKTVLNHVQVPCIIDADGLNLLAAHPDWMEQLKDGDYILTPHMKELSRMTGHSIEELKKDRKKAMCEFTELYQTTLVQKDARTLVGGCKKTIYVNRTGNAAMAKAGSGDVLAGIITALRAQELSAYDAAVLGVYLHGLAGDAARDELGRYSVLARDLVEHIASGIRRIENEGKNNKDETIYQGLCQN